MMNTSLALLPPRLELETKAVLKKAALANRYLAELKGMSRSIPNQAILINTLVLQEGKDSSAIENIITTHDELYRESLIEKGFESAAAKEVKDYAVALNEGFSLVRNHKLLTCNDICAIQRTLERNDAGFRSQAGTKLVNDQTGEVVYVPPQDPQEILALMGNLERAINDDEFWPGVDPLVKMAAIHYQFESIHPFFDGNGRTGRIINVLYLVLKDLLNLPILYLSWHILQRKGDYYRGLREVRAKGDWEGWILFMLDAVAETAQHTLRMVEAIGAAMMNYKHGIRERFGSFYSQDLINALFLHPYTKITQLEGNLKVSRKTAKKYLDELTAAGYLSPHRHGRHSYYVNAALFDILSQGASARGQGAPSVQVRTVNR